MISSNLALYLCNADAHESAGTQITRQKRHVLFGPSVSRSEKTLLAIIVRLLAQNIVVNHWLGLLAVSLT
jgi:hypothetical protein